MAEVQAGGGRDAVIERFTAFSEADDRIVASFLGGSLVRGGADAYSDVDLCLVAKDEAFDDVVAGTDAIVDALGERLFLEDFGAPDNVYFILGDGTEGEIFLAREGALDELEADVFRVLYDPQGLLTGRSFSRWEPDPSERAEQLRQVLNWFWHDLSHFISAIGRDQPWWAAGQLEALRRYCVNLVRIEQSIEALDEAYDKLDHEIETEALAPLKPTFVPMERAAMLEAAQAIVAFFRERAPIIAAANSVAYPDKLEQVLTHDLDELTP
jgi:Streptomycin adenylyltransferase